MLISAVAAMLLLAAPESTPAADTAAKPASEAKVEAKKVCTRTVLPGTNLPKRVCVTEAPKAAPKKEAEEAPADKPAA